MGKYHFVERASNYYVWFKLLDKNGKVLRDYPSAACFGAINTTMDSNTATIHVYRPKNLMPYNVPEIKRWINDINEMGFPCEFDYDSNSVGDSEKQEKWANESVKKDLSDLALTIRRHGSPAPVDPNQYYNFYVHLKYYVNKSHVFSTLSLIRALSESYMSTIPEIYFETMDKNPNADKFQALQDAHKTGRTSGHSHAVTYNGNGSNVSHKKLMDRFKEKADIYNSRLAIHAAWKG